MKSELQKTSFGLINKNWNLIPFENITINQQNGLYKSKEFQGKGTKIVKMGNQYGHPRVYDQEMDRYDLTENELKKFQLHYDDLLFSRRSLVFDGAGECSIVKEKNEPLIFESSIIRVTLNKEIALSDYFFYFFQSHLGKQLIRSINQGTSIAGITGTDLKKILVPLPDLTEQKSIVQIFSKIDDKLENLQHQNKILEQTAQTIFKSWFIDFDGVTEFEDSELGNIPKEWKVSTIKQILKEKGYIRGPFGSSLKRAELKSEGIPIYEQQHIIKNHRNFRFFIDDEKFKKMSRFTVKENDILVSCSGTVGRISTIKKNDPVGIISQALLILRPDTNKILPKFLEYFLRSNIGQNSIISASIGSVQINLARREIIESIELVQPPNNILQKFEKIASNINLILNQNKKNLKTLMDTRNLLLSKLMSGEIRL